MGERDQELPGIRPRTMAERLWAYSVPNSGSKDGQDFLDEVADFILATTQKDELIAELVGALHQYRSDMLYPPEADSRERRVAMIDAVLAKVPQP